jgi:hypothetical protein
MRLTPSTVLAGAALFFALGGSAVAVTDAVRPQARCQPGTVRGFIDVTGDPAKGMANFPDQFTNAKPLVGARFNCGGAPQARRVSAGVFEVRFPGNASRVVAASSPNAETTVGAVGGGVFRVSLWVPGRQDAIDTSFTVLVV